MSGGSGQAGLDGQSGEEDGRAHSGSLADRGRPCLYPTVRCPRQIWLEEGAGATARRRPGSEPGRLLRRVDNSLESAPDDDSPLLKPEAWDTASKKACRGPATGWHTGAEGLRHLSPALSGRLRRAFGKWAEAPGSTLPEGWSEAHASFLPSGQSREIGRLRPIVPPIPAVGVPPPARF